MNSNRQKFETGPSVANALDEWERTHDEPVISVDSDDTSRAELYEQDTWQPVFSRMRQTAPVNHLKGTAYGDFWNVCSYDALCEAMRPDLFSSSWEYGGITIADPDPEEEFHLPMFIAMDEPQHSIQRKTVAPAFSPAEIARLSDDIRTRTGEILDSLPIGETIDWVEQVSIELAKQILAMILGFPWKDRHLLTFWSDWAGNMEVTRVPELAGQRRTILGEMAQYFHQLWDEKRSSPPTNDLLSMMIHSESMSQMGEFEFMGNLALLIVGGNDTTRNSMSGAVIALHEFPDQRAKLQAAPTLTANAVHEILRWHTPISHVRRTATQDCELAGQSIAKGDKLALWYISANRDDTVFRDADRFDIERANARRHLAFGLGIHRCVGARLGELQLRLLLEEMARRRIQVDVTGEVRRARANFVHGFHKIEAVVTRY